MKIVWTKHWAIKPETHYRFRIGNLIYHCYFTFWHIAVIELNGRINER